MNQPRKRKDMCDICLYHTIKCICKPHWKTFDSVVDNYYKFINNGTTFELLEKPLSISTITFGFKLLHVGLDFKIIERCWKPSMFIFDISNNSLGRKSRTNMDINKRMYNTLTISGFISLDKDPKILLKISIALFHTGSIGIRGCKTLKQCIICMHKLIRFLKKLEEDPFIYYDVHEYVDVKSLHVTMIKGKVEETYNNISRVRVDYGTWKGKRRIFRMELKIKNPDGSYRKQYLEGVSKFVVDNNNNYGNILQIDKKLIHPFAAKVDMINSSFKVNIDIKLSALNAIIMDNFYSIHNKGPIYFNPEKIYGQDNKKNYVNFFYVPEYSNINPVSRDIDTRRRQERYMNQMTVHIHSTGSIVINGGKQTRYLFDVYTFLINLFLERRETIEWLNPRKRVSVVYKKDPYTLEDIDILTRHKLYKKTNKLNELQRKYKTKLGISLKFI